MASDDIDAAWEASNFTELYVSIVGTGSFQDGEHEGMVMNVSRYRMLDPTTVCPIGAVMAMGLVCSGFH